MDLEQLVDPSHTAVVTCELQRGVVGDLSPMRELADEVTGLGVIDAAARLAKAARAVGVRVVHGWSWARSLAAIAAALALLGAIVGVFATL